MTLKTVLKKVAEEIKPNKETLKTVKKQSKKLITALDAELKKQKVGFQIFIGGSFAKNTLIKKEEYDVDIFVRIDWRYDVPSEILKKAIEKVCEKTGAVCEKIHGSRDYFRVFLEKDKNYYFEIIPVSKIKKVGEARNVTDLSYFHVGYFKRKGKGLEDEVRLAKKFCQAQRVYGAESYVQGFSGYALECLILHYKTFEKMLKELSKNKLGERIIIDSAKHYKKKQDILFELNESKLHSPIILVDPTYNERNVLAALSQDTFENFKESAKKFLKNPSTEFFVEKGIDVPKLKKMKGEFLHIILETNRQRGDIAGTKMKKFAGFLEEKFRKYFHIQAREFEYLGEQKAHAYFVLKSLKEIERTGPPTKTQNKELRKAMKKHITAFRKEHKKVYEEAGILKTKIKVNFSAKEFLENWMQKNKSVAEEMGIIGLRVE